MQQLNVLGESYVDVLHNLGPLSTGLFRYVYGGTGQSLFLPRILAGVLCFVQVIILTVGINNVNGFREFNAFIGVIYIVLLHLFPDMLILTPLLIGMTFIIFKYVLVLSIIRNKAFDGSFLYAGIATSLAGIFLFPLFLFAIPTFLIIIIYTRFDIRSIGLFLLGLILPLFTILAYYYFQNYTQEYIKINFYYGFSMRFVSQLSVINYFIIAFVPFVLFLVAFLKTTAMYNMVNYQQKMIVAAVFYLITAFVLMITLPDKSIYYLLLFVPFLIHFMGILFIETTYKKINQMALASFVVLLAIPYFYKVSKFKKYLDYSPLYAQEIIPKYGKVLNLSDDKNILMNNTYATGFCEYIIARSFFLDPSPEATILVFDKLEADLPDAIYDPNGIVKKKFEAIPVMKRKFRYIRNLKIYKQIR